MLALECGCDTESPTYGGSLLGAHGAQGHRQARVHHMPVRSNKGVDIAPSCKLVQQCGCATSKPVTSCSFYHLERWSVGSRNSMCEQTTETERNCLTVLQANAHVQAQGPSLGLPGAAQGVSGFARV